MLTPKGGFSLYNMLNVFYGYNLYSDKVPGLSRHQVELTMNFNRSVWKQLKE